MVNEYASVGGGGPSAGYSGAGGGSPGSAYTSDPLSAASAAAATVTGGNVVSGQVISGSYGSDTAFQEALTVGVTTPQFGTASSYDITPRGPISPSSGSGLDYGMSGAPVFASSSGTVQPLPSSTAAGIATAAAAAAQQQAQQSSSTPGTYYVPYGSRTQTELKDISAVRFGAAGEVGFYQSLYTPEGNLRNITNLVSSGGPAALQSGMFSERPLTPDIRTQENPEAYARTAIPVSAAAVRASPESFSRLGAEVYGGYVLPLDVSRTVESVGAELSTYAPESGNLARLVSPQGANLPRSEYVSLPWGEYVAPGSGTKRVGSDTSGFREFATPALFAASSYDITLKSIPSTTRGADYGIGTKYVPGIGPAEKQIGSDVISPTTFLNLPFGFTKDVIAGVASGNVNKVPFYDLIKDVVTPYTQPKGTVTSGEYESNLQKYNIMLSDYSAQKTEYERSGATSQTTYDKLSENYATLVSKKSELDKQSQNIVNPPTLMERVGSGYEKLNIGLSKYTTDVFGIGATLKSTPDLDLKKYGDTSQMPYAEPINFAKGAISSMYQHPIDVALSYGGGKIFGLAEGGGKVLVAKAAMSETPIISTAGRVGSTPLASDIYSAAKGLFGGYVVYEAAANIAAQPTTVGKGESAGRTALQFGGFAAGMKPGGIDLGGEPPNAFSQRLIELQKLYAEPENIYAGKPFALKAEVQAASEPKVGPLTSVWETGVVKAGQAELYARGMPEEAKLLGEAFTVHKATRGIQPYDSTGKIQLWDIEEVPFEHKVVLDKALAETAHSLYGSGVQIGQSVPLEKIPAGKLGTTPSSDVDVFARTGDIMAKLAETPGAIVKTKEVPSVSGGMRTEPTSVRYGGYEFAVDVHNVPITYPRLPSEVGGRSDIPGKVEWRDLIAFKVFGDPFAASPKSWQLTKVADEKTGKITQVYEHSDVQQVRLMDALRKNILTATSEEPTISRGGRFEKDTTRLLSRFEDAIQTARLKEIAPARAKAEAMEPGKSKTKALEKISTREKQLAQTERVLEGMKERIIRYRPGVEQPIQEVRVGDLQTIAQENLGYGLSLGGKSLTTPKVVGPLTSLEEYTFMKAPTSAKVDAFLNRQGMVASQSAKEVYLSDIPYQKKTTKESVQAWLKKTGERPQEIRAKEPVATKTIRVGSPEVPRGKAAFGLEKGIGGSAYARVSERATQYSVPSPSQVSIKSPVGSTYGERSPSPKPPSPKIPSSPMVESPPQYVSPPPSKISQPIKTPPPVKSPPRSPAPMIVSPPISKPPYPPKPQYPKPPVKIPGLVPSVPYGGGGAGARGERGRRFTKELRVGEGIGWINVAGTQRRQSRKK